MDAVRSTWTDERLDDFRADVNRRFDSVDRGLEVQSDRIDRLQHLMVQGFIAIMATMFTGFAGLAGLILTKL